MPATSLPSLTPLLIALLAFLAIALIFWKYRPGRTRCPQTCARCGYNVSHRPDLSTFCSECGADLLLPAAVIRTRRTRPWWYVATASVLLAGAATGFCLQARRFPWSNWYLKNAPTSWIAAHARAQPNPFAARAFDQWLLRYRQGALAPHQSSRFHDHLLKWQADTARPWDPNTGDLLHQALIDKKLSDAQATQFVRGAFSNVKLRTRSPIRAGDPVPIEHSATFRGGTRGTWGTKRGVFANFNQPPQPSPEGKYGWAWGGWSGNPNVRILRPQDAGSQTLSPGQHKLQVLLVLKLFDSAQGDAAITPGVEHRATLDVSVLPAGTKIGTPYYGDMAGGAIGGATKIALYHWGDERIFAAIRLERAPFDRAFDVYVEHQGKRHLIAQRVAKAGGYSSFHNSVEYVPIKDTPDLRTLTLILAGSHDALAHSVDQQKYWKGAITFPNVPLSPQEDSYSDKFPTRQYNVAAEPDSDNP